MTFYAVHYAYTSDAAAMDEVRPAHREYLRGLADEGSMRASGPYVGVEPSALLIFTADSADEVRDLLSRDPFQQAGLVEQTTVTEWNPIIGVFADQV